MNTRAMVKYLIILFTLGGFQCIEAKSSNNFKDGANNTIDGGEAKQEEINAQHELLRDRRAAYFELTKNEAMKNRVDVMNDISTDTDATEHLDPVRDRMSLKERDTREKEANLEKQGPNPIQFPQENQLPPFMGNPMQTMNEMVGVPPGGGYPMMPGAMQQNYPSQLGPQPAFLSPNDSPKNPALFYPYYLTRSKRRDVEKERRRDSVSEYFESLSGQLGREGRAAESPLEMWWSNVLKDPEPPRYTVEKRKRAPEDRPVPTVKILLPDSKPQQPSIHTPNLTKFLTDMYLQ